MRKRLGICLCAAILLFSVFPCHANGISTSATSSILVDAESGRVLYEQNADREMLIASTTKIMTALLTLERCKNLEEKIKIATDITERLGKNKHDYKSLEALKEEAKNKLNINF